ncbi:MAG: hypothetical protein ACLQVD_14360 [Capsulimonadaceae bacterium]
MASFQHQKADIVRLANGAGWVLSVVLSAGLVWSACDCAQHAGPLWRDEANSVNVASLPGAGAIWRHLQFDSFPVLWLLVLHIWIRLVGAGNDPGIRLLGFLLAACVVPALWFSTRRVSGQPPLLALALLALNPVFLRTMVSNRAYGLGIDMLVVCAGLVWSVQRPADSTSGSRANRTAWALTITAALVVAATASIVFYNCVFLAALIGAGLVCALRRRDRPACFRMLLLGAAVALSLLPYVPIFALQRQWSAMVVIQTDFTGMTNAAVNVLDEGGDGVSSLWMLLAAVGVLTMAGLLLAGRRGPAPVDAAAAPSPEVDTGRADTPGVDAAVFGVVSATLLTVLYVVFLTVLRYMPYPWFFATPMAIAALSLDIALGEGPPGSGSPTLKRIAPGVLGRFEQSAPTLSALARRIRQAWPDRPRTGSSWSLRRVWPVLRVAAALWIVSAGSQGLADGLRVRQTNVDTVAAYLSKAATPGDLILVHPWQCGITFTRYYQGHAAWSTIPELPQHRWGGYQEIKGIMQQRDPMAGLRGRMKAALQAGRTVWVVGGIDKDDAGYPPAHGASPPAPAILPPAPSPKIGWCERDYSNSWYQQVGFFLTRHATKLSIVTLREHVRVNGLENLPLDVARGWRPDASEAARMPRPPGEQARRPLCD